MEEKTIPTEETIRAFYIVAEFMRKRCVKFKYGSCLGCPFLNRYYKRCLMSMQFNEPHTVTEDMLIETIESNLEAIKDPNFPYKDFI